MRKSKIVKFSFSKPLGAKASRLNGSNKASTNQTQEQPAEQKSSGDAPADHRVTMLLIKMRAENEKVGAQLRAQKLVHSNLIDKLKRERTAHQQTRIKLDRNESMLNQLRKLSAAVQIKACRLAKEKSDLKRQAEVTIKETQADLEASWLESICCARIAASTQN